MTANKKDNVKELPKPKISREQEAFMNIAQLAQMGLANECNIVGLALEKLAKQDD